MPLLNSRGVNLITQSGLLSKHEDYCCFSRENPIKRIEHLDGGIPKKTKKIYCGWLDRVARL